MTNQDVASHLTELVANMTTNMLSFSLSPKHKVNEHLEQELNELTQMVYKQTENGSIGQKRSETCLALISGLYLWCGNFDSSHTIAQDLDNRTGSYLHGIIHRIEPDYSNAKYWFRNAGGHPEGKRLHKETLELLEESISGNEPLFHKFNREIDWNPLLFTDLAAAALKSSGTEKEVQLLERIQANELRLLLNAVLCELED